ncbi:MAG: glutaredoxin 3 [Hyphomicrobiaceae bacterium]|nr:glutaredoxin 3 [Hyphomicrobiaceae bacterium]
MPEITVYTTPFCPYCIAAKRMLKKKGAKFSEIDVSDQSKREAMIARSNGKYTVPQIFIAERHIGGFDDLSELEALGELDPLLAG